MNDTIYTNGENLPTIIRNNVRIDWVNLNEGLDGDYDPENPEDKNLLRFNVHRFNGNLWQEVEDASYCTLVEAKTERKKLVEHLIHFMDTIYDDVSAHGKAKRICESLSWTK